VVGTAGGGNYDFASADASGYAGKLKAKPVSSLSDSKDPYYGYLLVTVSPDNTYAAVFKGVRKSQLATGMAFQVLDPKP
jgi:hypothetical protein